MNPVLSIITVNYCSFEWLRVLAEALRFTTSSSYELLVWDNSEEPLPSAWVRDNVNGYYFNGKNLGHGAALDVLATKAAGEYIVSFDVDARPLKVGWDGALRQRLSETVLCAGIGARQPCPRTQRQHFHVFIHPSCLLISSKHFRECALSFQAEWPKWDVAERITVELRERGLDVAPVSPTCARYSGGPDFKEPGSFLGIEYEGLLYHHWYATRFAGSSATKLEGVSREKAEASYSCEMNRFWRTELPELRRAWQALFHASSRVVGSAAGNAGVVRRATRLEPHGSSTRHVTIALCASSSGGHDSNRDGGLCPALESVESLSIPEGVEVRLLIVSDCADETRPLLSRLGTRMPLRAIRETGQGLAHARNCALDEAKGDLILFLDDDMTPDRNWLLAYLKAAQAYGDAAYFGGPVVPSFADNALRWLVRLARSLEPVYGGLDLGRLTRPFQCGEYPYGGNMGFRRSRVDGFRFDVATELPGRLRPMAEEAMLGQALARQGMSGVWVSDARSLRRIVPRQMTRRYIGDFYCALGATRVIREGVPSGTLLLGAPRWLYRRYVEWLAIEAACRLGGRTLRWLDAYRNRKIVQGIIRECRLRHFGCRAATGEV